MNTNSLTVPELGNRAITIIEEIFSRARDTTREDSEAAAKLLLGVSDEATYFLTELCTALPEKFMPWAQQRENWPVLYHRHPDLNRRVEKAMKELELGSSTELNYLNKSFNHNTPANVVVLDLYHRTKVCQKHQGRVPWLFLFKAETVVPEHVEREVEDWCLNVVPKLPPLNRNNYQEWNKKTRLLLRVIYGGDFQNHQQFAKIVQRVRQTDRNRNPSPAHRRDAVYRALRDAWKSISAIPVKG